MNRHQDHASPPTPAPVPRRQRGVNYLALCAVLLLAAFFRLHRLDLIEFKADEAKICTGAIRMIEEHTLATHGLTSGTGIRNFPLFAWLMTIPVAFTRNPLPLTAIIAVINVAAIGVTFHLAQRRWGLAVAFWTALLMACS